MKQGKLKSSALLTLLLLAAVFTANAQTDPINIVTTAVPFLRISPDARAGGMGDIGIATSPDANSSFWNVAKAPFATSKGALSATYTPWLKDIAQDVYLATLAGYYQLDEEQALSGSIRYFNLGDIQFTDFSGQPLQTYRPREFAIDFGYSRKLSDKLGVGVSLRYINSSLANGEVGGTIYKAGSAVAGDLSLYHNGLNEEGQGFTWGIALSNLGSKIGYTNNAQTKDFIPANLGIGGAYTSVFDETSKITFGLDINKLLVPAIPADSNGLETYHNYGVFESWFHSFSNKAYQASIGAEYGYNDQFFVRAGYFFEGKNAGNRKYATVGVGLKYDAFGFNFSYLVPSGNGITRNPLSNTLRFSLVFDLGGTGDNSGE
ncbi:MAG: type IX secretion system outer membrane channel protein PorV [Ilyomonas sp.]